MTGNILQWTVFINYHAILFYHIGKLKQMKGTLIKPVNDMMNRAKMV